MFCFPSRESGILIRMAKRGRRPQGDESRVVVAATKLTESEAKALADQYGSTYAGLRVAVSILLKSDK